MSENRPCEARTIPTAPLAIMAGAAQLLVQWRNAVFQPSLSNNQTLSKGRISNDQSAALERLVPYLAPGQAVLIVGGR